MNLYFLVEGTTESEFYPKFISYYFDGLFTRQNFSCDVSRESDNYVLLNSCGCDFLYTGSQIPKDEDACLKNAIKEINANPVFDYLVVCIDADELSIEERQAEFEGYVSKYARENIVLTDNCAFKLVVQNRCLETWFLGNEKMFKQNPTGEPYISYRRYYDVKQNDPEQMGNYNDAFTHQDFHLQYLRTMLREKKHIYKKENPENVLSVEYLGQLKKRVSKRNRHLPTFAEFVDFCDRIKNNINSSAKVLP